jgi:hypothetical protein
MSNPPRPVKWPRLESFTSNSLFDNDSELSEGSEHTELTLPLLCRCTISAVGPNIVLSRD